MAKTPCEISSMEIVHIWQAIDMLIAATTHDEVKLCELEHLRKKLRNELDGK